MNIARLFSYTKEVERQRDEWRERVSALEDERRKLVDALARSAGKPPVFNQPPQTQQSSVPSVAIGPSAAAARRELKRQEDAEAAKGRAAANGNPVDIPVINNR